MNQDEEIKRTFQVEIEQVKRHLFVVDDVNSQEEAEDVATDWLADGEEGAIMEEDILSTDAYPVENERDVN